jgi:hypothetical protein
LSLCGDSSAFAVVISKVRGLVIFLIFVKKDIRRTKLWRTL